MATITRGELVSLTRELMDAVGSTRWSDEIIKQILNNTYDTEWSNILNAYPYYTFTQKTVSTDESGQIPFTELDTGGGDTMQHFYRVLSVNDGSVIYTETRFQDVPLATTTNYLPTYPRLYYVIDQKLQLLPVLSAKTIYVAVNWKPTALLDLSSDSATINFPENNYIVLAAEAAAALLLKGGAEANAAANYKKLAADNREIILDDLRRRTINPTRMAYPDLRYDWAGG
jgi:hypothetical protein